MKQKIVVLAGGESPEHDISLQSAMNVVRYMDIVKYNIFPAMITKSGEWMLDENPIAKAQQIEFEYNNYFKIKNTTKMQMGEFISAIQNLSPDLVFIMMHGPDGEDGKIQSVFELLKIPFTGPDSIACAVSMDKVLTKLIIEKIGYKTPDYYILTKSDWFSKKETIITTLQNQLGFPQFIKIPNLGSSYGIGIADDEDQLIELLDKFLKESYRVLIERYIEGIELTVPILGNSSNGSSEALPVIQIVPKKTRFFDLEAKYDNSITDEIVPAPIDDVIRDRCQKAALEIYNTLGCDGMARVDLIWADDTPYFLEVNPIPGFTSASLYPKSAAVHGLDYPGLLNKLIMLALEK